MRDFINTTAKLFEGIYDDDDDEPSHGSFGWWIFPDGEVSEIEEAGNHGWEADQWLSQHTNIPEVPYDEAIEKLVELGGVRVATFHGSDIMAFNLPSRLAPVVKTALLKLVNETKHDFTGYIIDDDNPHQYNFREVINVIRSHS
jgi:hypothetical protein